MNILAVIPARYDSKRFPGKPLALINNKPMIQWVYEAARSCPEFSKVVVATDDERIADCVRGFSGLVEMTRSDHETGTDRVAEVARKYPDFDVVANVQGDQPFVTSEMLSQLLKPYLCDELPDMTTLACHLDPEEGRCDENTVKVLCNSIGDALYFSRSPIPFMRKIEENVPVYHHLGLYAFERKFLAKYSDLPSTPLERCESLEQLRVLENGFSIRVCLTESSVLEINTPEDWEQACRNF